MRETKRESVCEKEKKCTVFNDIGRQELHEAKTQGVSGFKRTHGKRTSLVEHARL